MLTTLIAMRTDVLDRADMELGGPISKPQVNQRINAAIGIVYNAIVKARGDTYFEVDAPNIVTSNTVQEYSLPVDFLKVSPGGVWWITGTGQNLPIRQYNPNESMIQIANQGWWYEPYATTVPVRYRVRGGKIRFVPVPNGAYTVLVKYIPRPAVLSADTDPWDGYDGFEEAVKWHAAASCLGKEKVDNSYELQMYASEMQRLLENVERDNNEPPQVQWFSPESGYDIDL